MTASVTVRHNFETGHRLPFLKGKCENLHGHSWWGEVTVTAETVEGVVVEFGRFKSLLRTWIDIHLDHGLMLGHDDPLADVLEPYGKVYRFEPDNPLTAGLDWPTVENVAALLARVAEEALSVTDHAPGAEVTGVTVTETHVNLARWSR